jgi:sulfur-carrier protein adenylyltransferase/sulfurtransferase
MLSTEELRRYARHLNIPGFGIAAQEQLAKARVLMIGAGGLGSPAAMYLAAAGVGTLRLVDADTVDLSNLQRQLLHGQQDIGRKKLHSAADRLREINPHVKLELHDTPFTADNAMELAAGCDVILDGTDNFPTRYLSNDVAVWRGIPNVYGSILRYDGQVSVFAPHLGGPCYRCMAPVPPAPGLVPSCAEGGVLGALPGIIGSMQALEVIKLVTGQGQPLIGRLLHFDTLNMTPRIIRLRRDEECPVCGSQPTITEPIDYHGFCNPPQPQTPDNTMSDVTVQELQEMREAKQPHLLVDVREQMEYDVGSISGSILIPLSEFGERFEELPRDQKLIIHCKIGGRSARAVAFLQQQGYKDVSNVPGGITAWSQEIDPTVQVM